MIANPAQLLVLPFLGLLALAILAGALVLLRQSFRPTQVRMPTRGDRGSRAPAVDLEAEAVMREAAHRRDRVTRRIGLAVGLLLVAWVFLGRFVVAAFASAGGARPVEDIAYSRIAGPAGTSLQVGERGRRDGATLVFTHGWGADQRDWAEIEAALPPDLHLVSWDLPGLGASTRGDRVPESMAAMADALDAVVQAKGGTGPVILVGHSIGGMLNLEYVRRHADRLGAQVAGVVEVNTTFTDPLLTKAHAERSRRLQPVYEPLLRFVEATAPACRGLGWLAWSSGLAHVELAMQSFAGRETWAQLDDMARFAYRSDPGVVAQGVIAMMHWDATDVLAAVDVPTLVLAGAQDRTTLPAASERMVHDIPSAQLFVVAPAAHLGPVESAPEYARRIAEFAHARARHGAAVASSS